MVGQKKKKNNEDKNESEIYLFIVFESFVGELPTHTCIHTIS